MAADSDSGWCSGSVLGVLEELLGEDVGLVNVSEVVGDVAEFDGQSPYSVGNWNG